MVKGAAFMNGMLRKKGKQNEEKKEREKMPEVPTSTRTVKTLKKDRGKPAAVK